MTEELPETTEPVDDVEAPDTRETAAGGWCAPSDSIFGLLAGPDITARRGGLTFTAPSWPKPVDEMTKKELRAEVELLRKMRDGLIKARDKESKRRRKAERKVRRLVKLLGRIA